MKVRLCLQARTNSSRLPAKILLPVGGIPLVVLAALRAGNTGHPVTVLTSREASDDLLCDVLSRWNISYYRGDLTNTLKRFVDSTEELDDEHVVVRLTGDNVFPDGEFIDEMLADFQSRNLPYLGCGGEKSGLPYGVSAEITRVGYLREASEESESPFDREHVTPWIIEKYGRSTFEKYRTLGMSHYRCTVDTLDDYLRVAQLFGNLAVPEETPLGTLLDKLKSESGDIVTHRAASRLVLGTAQFGLNYGIANKTGRPHQDVVTDLVQTAIRNGIQFLDTARAYGESEKVLKSALAGGWCSRATVMTKLSPMDDCPVDASPEVVAAFVERSVFESCTSLGVSGLDVLMLHRASHLSAWNGGVWATLDQLKNKGLIEKLGVSVQSPEEAMNALEYDAVSVLQMPFNILDFRWESVIARIGEVRRQRSLTVHVRSALLQGLLTTAQPGLWRRARCESPNNVIAWLQQRASEHCGGDVVELCLRFAISQDWVDGVVLGLDTKNQLLQNLKIIEKDMWPADRLREIVDNRPSVPAETLDPAKWEKTNA